MWAALAVGAQLGLSIIGGSRARKQQRKELMNQRILEEDAARKERADLAAQVDASNAARALAAEREVLSDQAEVEARRQARMASVDTDVEIADVSGTERARRRRAFQDGNML
jgi:hypothetical protein